MGGWVAGLRCISNKRQLCGFFSLYGGVRRSAFLREASFVVPFAFVSAMTTSGLHHRLTMHNAKVMSYK